MHLAILPPAWQSGLKRPAPSRPGRSHSPPCAAPGPGRLSPRRSYGGPRGRPPAPLQRAGPRQDAATRLRAWAVLPARPPARAGPASRAAGGTGIAWNGPLPAPGSAPVPAGGGWRAGASPPGPLGPTAEASAARRPGRGAPAPRSPAPPGRYRFRCSLKSAVSARRASRSWMGAGTMTPDSRAGGGLGAAILPLAARGAGRRREAGGGGAEGPQAGEERAPQQPDAAAAAASAPLQPRSGGKARRHPLSLPSGGDGDDATRGGGASGSPA